MKRYFIGLEESDIETSPIFYDEHEEEELKNDLVLYNYQAPEGREYKVFVVTVVERSLFDNLIVWLSSEITSKEKKEIAASDAEEKEG